MTVEAVDLVDHHYVELTIFGVLHQAGQVRAEAVFLGGNAGVGVDLQQIPALPIYVILDVLSLRVQAVPVHLFAHGYPAVSNRSQSFFLHVYLLVL